MLRFTLNKAVSEKLMKKADKYPDLVQSAMRIAIQRVGFEIRQKARDYAPVKTGVLRRSLFADFVPGTNNLVVAVGTDLIYARIQDLGGIIKPKNKEFLRFQIGDKVIYTRGPIKIPKYHGRGFLTPAFREVTRSKSKQIFKEEIIGILGGV